MKPSERINEIYKELRQENAHKPLTEFLNAICHYLDETYEAETLAIEKLKRDLKPM